MEFAVVIGIDHYEKKPLKGAVADAHAFAEWLRQKRNINVENLKLLVSEDSNNIVSGTEIDLAFNNICRLARNAPAEPHRLYFYFSGHGIGMTFDNTALCLRLWPEFFNHCISGLDYKTGFINKGMFSEILIFFDCCRENDTLIKANSPIGSWNLPTGNRDLIPDIVTCNSTAFGKLSYEYTPEPEMANDDQKTIYNGKRGAFTTFLIDSLNGDADPGNGTITAMDLKKHFQANFKTYAQSKGKQQDASVDTQQRGDGIVLTVLPQVSELDHNCEITITKNRNVTLFSPTYEQIDTYECAAGMILKLKLEKGIHQLKDNMNPDDQPKNIINYSANTISYDIY
jgi:hypothetical protein